MIGSDTTIPTNDWSYKAMLDLDPRKWGLFLFKDNRDLCEPYTIETIFDLRLSEALQQFGFRKHDVRFPSHTYKNMLIIGAGVGGEILAAESLGYNVTGIGFLNEAQYQYALKIGCNFIRMDMHDIRFPNESFDVIYSSHSFEHCVHPWLVCIEFWAVLRVGGRVWINLPNYRVEQIGLHHFMVLKPEFMTRLFTLSGFKVIEIVDDPSDYSFLLEKVSIEALREIPNNISQLISKRMKIGEDYK